MERGTKKAPGAGQKRQGAKQDCFACEMEASSPGTGAQGALAASAAKRPGDRFDFIRQVQGHTNSTCEDVATAAIIASFVNSKAGATFVRFDVLARIMRVSRRTLLWRLARLKERGHITIKRRGQSAPEIVAHLLPDSVPYDAPEVQPHCTSDEWPEVQPQCTSEGCPEVQSPRTSETIPEVQSHCAQRCNDEFVSHSKLTVPEDPNTGITREYGEIALEREAGETAPSGAPPKPPAQSVSAETGEEPSAGSLAHLTVRSPAKEPSPSPDIDEWSDGGDLDPEEHQSQLERELRDDRRDERLLREWRDPADLDPVDQDNLL
ncbi:MAG: hypothetical protein EKK29_07025 [Hyphomicrobiales bacterium]|nr:MAG: hypothetical protein EKK29_07025 [Hyphomicrobiales bacterium]